MPLDDLPWEGPRVDLMPKSPTVQHRQPAPAPAQATPGRAGPAQETGIEAQAAARDKASRDVPGPLRPASRPAGP